jgi:hypothetical protein
MSEKNRKFRPPLHSRSRLRPTRSLPAFPAGAVMPPGPGLATALFANKLDFPIITFPIMFAEGFS